MAANAPDAVPIRPAGAADAPVLAALHRDAFPAEPWGPDAIALMLELPGTHALLWREHGFVMLRVAADEAEILTLAVSPPQRRRGCGAALLGAALGCAAARGAAAMFLEVAEGNAAARALYAGAGFSEIGRRRRYYADRSDALVLRRDLAPFAPD